MTNIVKEMKTIINGVGYNQFGKEILVTQMPFSFLEAVFEVDPEVQRKLDPGRRSEIRDFIIKSTEENDFYFSPFVFSARGAIIQTEDGWELTPGAKLYILDGMHRSSGLSSAISQLKSKKETAEETYQIQQAEMFQARLEKIRTYPVSMQIYLNLTQEEERQLFTDINTERREVHIGAVMQYDQRDEYTRLTRKVAHILSPQMDIEQKLSRIYPQSASVTSLTVMRKCLVAMFEGDLSAKWTEPSFRYVKKTEMEAAAISFFELWLKIFPKHFGNRKRFVTGLSGIQIALAYAVLELVKRNRTSHLEAIQLLTPLKKLCSWKHDDPLFSHMYRESSGIIIEHSRTTSLKKTALEFLAKLDEGGKR